MRLPDSAHTSLPWRIHALTRDFRLEDVWGIQAPGRVDDFPRAVHLATSLDPSRSTSGVVRGLFALRWRIGDLLGWDGARTGVGARVRTLQDRLPADLRERAGPEFAGLPFTPLYLLDDEFAAETANATMHGVMHLGWAPDEAGGHRLQMAVLVKPNGRFGDAYMAAIRPFRHRLVYPATLGELERAWRRGSGSAAVTEVAAL